MADQAYVNTLRLADENSALRDRIKELEAEQKYTSDMVSKLINQNVQDAKNINEIIEKYNAHLERGR